MAEDEKDDTAPAVNPAELLPKVEKQAATAKTLMVVVLAISAVIISVMATGMTVMFMRISDLVEATQITEEDPMEEQFLALEQQLMLLADFRKSEIKKISAYTKELEKIGADCSLEKAAPYRDFLLSREEDFQTLLMTIKSGSSDLAGMSQGSKTWLDAHTLTLDNLKDASVLRKNKLEQMLKKAK